MRTRYKIVARNQEELDKFNDTIDYGLISGGNSRPLWGC